MTRVRLDDEGGIRTRDTTIFSRRCRAQIRRVERRIFRSGMRNYLALFSLPPAHWAVGDSRSFRWLRADCGSQAKRDPLPQRKGGGTFTDLDPIGSTNPAAGHPEVSTQRVICSLGTAVIRRTQSALPRGPGPAAKRHR
jgi:hypothetical protein